MPEMFSKDALIRMRAFAVSSPKTAAALAVCACVGLVAGVHLALMLAGQASAIEIWRGLVRGYALHGGDSWDVMKLARDWLNTHPGAGGDLYREIFFAQEQKFQYAPTSLLSVELVILLGLEPTNFLFNSVSMAFLFLTAGGAGALVWSLPERLAAGPLDTDTRRARLLLVVAAGAATLMFFPLLHAVLLGQLQVWISGLFVAACVAWMLDRRALAGVLIGLICLLKPQFGLFAVWGLLRREWGFTLALAATGAAGLLLSVLLYGFASHLAYLDVLSFLSRHGESFWANQSANGLLHRVFGNADSAVFDKTGFPPFHPGVYAGTLLVTVGLIVSVFTLRRGQGKLVPMYDFLLATLAFTAASPIAWDHHYGVMTPMFAVLAAGWIFGKPPLTFNWPVALIAIAFVFTAVSFSMFAGMTGPLHILQSYLYFAAIIVLVTLWRLTADGWIFRSRTEGAG